MIAELRKHAVGTKTRCGQAFVNRLRWFVGNGNIARYAVSLTVAASVFDSVVLDDFENRRDQFKFVRWFRRRFRDARRRSTDRLVVPVQARAARFHVEDPLEVYLCDLGDVCL